jgi:hypothetical protein
MDSRASLCTTMIPSPRPTGRRCWRLFGPAALLVAAACSSPSSDSGGVATSSVVQELEAGEFVRLNEIKLNAPGPSGSSDAPWQFIELVGTPGATLAGFQVIAIDGLSGTVQLSVDLGTACGGPCAIGSNGILIIKAADIDGGEAGNAVDPAATVVTSATLATAPVRNDDAAIALVQGTVAIPLATVYPADAGTGWLPAGDSIVDGVGWKAGGPFTGVSLVQGSGRPDAATRFPGRTDTSVDAWYNGDLVAGVPVAQSGLVYTPAPATTRSSNLPAGALVTPGAPNFPFDLDAGSDAAADGGPEIGADTGSDTAVDAGSEAAVDAGADVAPDAGGSGGDDAGPDVAADTGGSNDEGGTDASSGDVSPVEASSGDVSSADASSVDASIADAGSTDARPDAIATDGAVADGATPPDARVDDAGRDGASGGSAGSAGTGGAGGSAGSGGSAGAGGAAAGGGGSGGRGGSTGAGAGGGGKGGTAGTSGTAGSGGAKAGAAGTGTMPPASDDGGCGCRTVGQPRGGAADARVAFVGLGAMLALRRRKKSHQKRTR